MTTFDHRLLLERLRVHCADERAAPCAQRSAVAVLLRPRGVGAEVLLMTRVSDERDPWSGQVSLPGGRCAPGDADLYATAVREAREEVGLDLTVEAELMCRLQPVRARAHGRLLDLDVTPFVFHATGELAPAPGPEARELFWLSLADAAAGRFDAEHALERAGCVRRFPAWAVEQRVIWGLTRHVLLELLEIASGRRG